MGFKHSTKQITGKKLPAFDIQLNAFGELVTSLKVEEINHFLNENVVDKKINNRAIRTEEKDCLVK